MKEEFVQTQENPKAILSQQWMLDEMADSELSQQEYMKLTDKALAQLSDRNQEDPAVRTSH